MLVGCIRLERRKVEMLVGCIRLESRLVSECFCRSYRKDILGIIHCIVVKFVIDVANRIHTLTRFIFHILTRFIFHLSFSLS